MKSTCNIHGVRETTEPHGSLEPPDEVTRLEAMRRLLAPFDQPTLAADLRAEAEALEHRAFGKQRLLRFLATIGIGAAPV